MNSLSTPLNRLVLIVVSMLIAIPILSSQGDWNVLIEKQEDFQKNAMMVLGGWGLANALSGGIGSLTGSGQTKYFHQMNAGWGIVNTGIALAGYIGARNFDLSEPITLELLNKNLSLSKSFLFNAGLDVGYIMGGFYLRERSKSVSNLPERLQGFGNSVILQGSFLFVFDLAAYVLNNKLTEGIKNASFKLGGSDNGMGLIINF